MGITGELVRSVFSKSKSIKTHETNIRSSYAEKKRWKASVKSYLCGDELFDSVLAEEDSASVKRSEATVTTQSLPEDGHSTTANIQSQYTSNHENLDRGYSSFSSNSLDEDAAAIIIQSAFRGFKVRCLRREQTTGIQNDFEDGMQSPSRESLATSIEVQTGNSIGVVSTKEDDLAVPTKLQHKAKHPAFKPKEDWDDSTLDSTRSKMRMQNRIEAMTRRERALAYAFSQQLRICAKKQHTKSDDGTEPNMGWSWLERWMATRQLEVSPLDDCTSKKLISNEAATFVKSGPLNKRFLDLSFEEKESCGSNEVPVQFRSSPNTEKEDKDGCKLARNRHKSPRSISRRKSVPAYHHQKEHSKVRRKDGSREPEKDGRQKAKQRGSSSSVCKDDASFQSSPDHSVSGQNSKSDP